MERFKLIVPKGIRFISDWCKLENGYSLENFQFPHMLDKKMTGCGFTEYCITNDLDMIICSPRRILLENKEDQHTGEVYYFRNELSEVVDNFDIDISGFDSKAVREKEKLNNSPKKYDPELISLKMFQLKKNLLSYIDYCRNSGRPVKILVTYDSFHLVKEFIETSNFYSIKSFYVVIDEAQSIFVDSRFKSDTELGFLNDLHGLNRLCFVSATPMLDHYLEMLDEFKDLPYFEMDWITEEEDRVLKPQIDVKYSGRLLSEAKSIIESYLSGNFEVYTYKDSLDRICRIESREAVLYFNSVKNICDLIKRCKLSPDNTNVLCSLSEVNQKAINSAFKSACGRRDGVIGTVPKKGEPHKMFTLCTRTVYLGADFYSTNARSFIFSDPNIDCLAVDISLDLPQILGRQRLDINPWKNTATLYYKMTGKSNSITKEDFDEIVRVKCQRTQDLIQTAGSISVGSAKITLLDTLEDAIKATHYKKNYLSIDRDSSGNMIPVLNKLVMVAEMRAFDVQQVDYKDRFAVFNSINDSGISISMNDTTKQYLDVFNSLVRFEEKLKYICEIILESGGIDNVGELLGSIPVAYRDYILILGPERCRAVGYKRVSLEGEVVKLVTNQDVNVSDVIYNRFNVGERYSLTEIKETLNLLYQEIGYRSHAKATDLEAYFELMPVRMSVEDEDGQLRKRVRGFEIKSRKF